MGKKIFNPHDWLKNDKVQNNNVETYISTYNSTAQNSEYDDIEEITRRIESAAIDIAPAYSDWRDLGFALASALGESGRNYFHRLSRFYPDYTQAETDKQFTACVKGGGSGVTIKTLFYLAKASGISVGIKAEKKHFQHMQQSKSQTSDKQENEDEVAVPTFPEDVFNNLPGFIQQVIDKHNSPEDRDLLMLGSLVTLSACLPKVYGIYAERVVYPNLFLFITAQASAGKGRLSLCRKLVEPIHNSLREISKIEFEDYQRKLTEFAAAKNKSDLERPVQPPVKMLIIPANNSATGLFQVLNDNDGAGLIFETEGDTLAYTFKSEYGNYSDGFRKAFHHEAISYNRRKDREYVEINNPRLSALLSGTPKQLSTLIPSAENGLFSRFIFYYMNIRPVWNDVFAGSDNETLDNYFDRLGYSFFDLYKMLNFRTEPIRFSLTRSQSEKFNNYFEQVQNQYLYLYGSEYLATVRRLGLITFRVAMILTVLRIMDDGHVESVLVCRDSDFNAAIEMVKVLVIHAARVFQHLPNETLPQAPKNQKQLFIDSLPQEFSRKVYLQVAAKLNIVPKTAEKHIKRFVDSGLVNHFAHDKYLKV